jgi:RNA recognition motif-containing protein
VGEPTTEEDLRQCCEPYSIVERVQLITDRDTGRSRGVGCVEMPDAAEAQAAMDGLQGTRLGGRTLTVNAARQREERRPRW